MWHHFCWSLRNSAIGIRNLGYLSSRSWWDSSDSGTISSPFLGLPRLWRRCYLLKVCSIMVWGCAIFCKSFFVFFYVEVCNGLHWPILWINIWRKKNKFTALGTQKESRYWWVTRTCVSYLIYKTKCGMFWILFFNASSKFKLCNVNRMR